MISCTEFIPAYSALFKYLEEKGGKKEVEDFWKYLSCKYLDGSLKKLVEENGIKGCWLYWSHSLNEEAADFDMVLDEKAGEFVINMHKCPSKGLLNGMEHIKPYEEYCLHCDLLYRRVLEPLGYDYDIDLSKCDNAECRITVRKSKK